MLQMLSYGCTRLEIGLQSIFEDVARDTNRGHTVAAVGDCFHLAKNAGFKVIAHMMPDLPNMGWERDMESFREFFENPDFRTDGLKVSKNTCSVGVTLPLSCDMFQSMHAMENNCANACMCKLLLLASLRCCMCSRCLPTVCPVSACISAFTCRIGRTCTAAMDKYGK